MLPSLTGLVRKDCMRVLRDVSRKVIITHGSSPGRARVPFWTMSIEALAVSYATRTIKNDFSIDVT